MREGNPNQSGVTSTFLSQSAANSLFRKILPV